MLTTLHGIFFEHQHVYSIQLSEAVHASALYAVDLEVFKEDPMGCCKHVAIKNPLAIPRAAVAPPKITPGVQMVKKEVKKTGALEGAFAKTKKASDEPVKSNSVSSVKELKPKEGNSPEKKSLSVNSGSKKAKPGGIANFFAAKPKADKPVQKADTGTKCEGKENIENAKSVEKEENQSTLVQKPPVIKAEKKSFGKKDKEEKRKVVDENKKRRRIQVLSDSEDDGEEEEDEKEKVEVEEPPPPQAQLLQSDSDEDEVIPATPKEKSEGTVRKGGRRRRVKKQVDKTYVDDDGYMVTKKVLESASETDDEDEDIPKAEAAKEEKKKEEAPAAKKQKIAAPGPKKQQGIASFFSKK